MMEDVRRGLVLLPSILALACADDPLTRLLPKLTVDPEAIDFGAGIVMQDNLQTLALKNEGDGVLVISGIDVEPAGGVFSVREVPDGLGSRAEDELTVVFVPQRAKERYDAKLIIHSDDPTRPNLEVPLTGVGGIREIEVFPTNVDFGVVNEGTAPRRAVEIRNLGGDPLDVSSVTFTSTSVDLGLLPGTPSRLVVPALTSTVVELVYSPTDLGADRGTLVLLSNDEDEPRVEVPVTGRANLAPRAIAWGCEKVANQIGCEGQQQRRSISAGLRRSVGLDGRESYDPEGGPLDGFRWIIVERPAPSNAAVFHSTDDLVMRKRATGDLLVDAVGRYDLRLVARDERGLESLDRPESHVVIGPKDLEVRLVWDIGTDLDLHLVRPNGVVGDYGNRQVGTSTGSDCSAFNREPNWNDPGSRLDDPRLDRDEVTGIGPEIISLDSPEAGAYTLYAHYCDSRNVNVNAHVTAELYVRGLLIDRFPVMDGFRILPGQLWEAATITWDATNQTATAAPGTAPVEARPQLCRN